MSKAEETFGWATLPLGTVLREKYRIDRVLGVGGTAVVYAVTHRNRRRFALKLLHPDLSRRPDVRARFAREGYVANTVEHPSIVEVLDDDVDEHGSAFLVMELLDGLSVEALCAEPSSTLPSREALELADQLLDALDHAHRKAVVHRDIKPSNLFLTREGRLKVLDFGVARLRERTPALKTHTGATLGTPAFMAPEQARSQAGAVDARSDVWAVGATLFTLLSGKHVHEGESARDVLVRSATEPPRSLASVMPDAPAVLVELVDRALRVDPNERFPTASAMREAVHEASRSLHGERPHGALRALVSERLSRSDDSTSRELSPTELFFASEPPAAGMEPHRRWFARGAVLAAVLALAAFAAFSARNWLEAASADSADPPENGARGTAVDEAAIAHHEPASEANPPTPPAPETQLQRMPVTATPRPTSKAAKHVAAVRSAAAEATPAPSTAQRDNPLHLEIQ